MQSLLSRVFRGPTRGQEDSSAYNTPSTSDEPREPSQSHEGATSITEPTSPGLHFTHTLDRPIHPDLASLVESSISAERESAGETRRSRASGTKSLVLLGSASTTGSEMSALSPRTHSRRNRIIAPETMPTIISADQLAESLEADMGDEPNVPDPTKAPLLTHPAPPASGEPERDPLNKMPSLPNLPSSRWQGTFGGRGNLVPPLKEFSFSSPFNRSRTPDRGPSGPSAYRRRSRNQSGSRSVTTRSQSKSRSQSATPSQQSSEGKADSRRSSPLSSMAARQRKQRASVSAVIDPAAESTPPPTFVSRFSRFSTPIARQLGFDSPHTFGHPTPSTPSRSVMHRPLSDTPPPPVPPINIPTSTQLRPHTSPEPNTSPLQSSSTIPPQIDASHTPDNIAATVSSPRAILQKLRPLSPTTQIEPSLRSATSNAGSKSSSVSRRASADWSGQAATAGTSTRNEDRYGWPAQVSREMVLLSLSRSSSPASRSHSRSRSHSAGTGLSRTRTRSGGRREEQETQLATSGRSRSLSLSQQARPRSGPALTSCPPDQASLQPLSAPRTSSSRPSQRAPQPQPRPRPASYTPSQTRRLEEPFEFFPLEFGYIGRQRPARPRPRPLSTPGLTDTALRRHLRREQSSSDESSLFFGLGWERRTKKRSMQAGGDDNNSSSFGVTSTPRIVTPPKKTSSGPPVIPPIETSGPELDLPSLSITAPTPQPSPGKSSDAGGSESTDLKMTSTLAVPGATITPIPSEKTRGKRKAEESEITPPDMKGSQRSTRFNIDPTHGSSSHHPSDASRTSHAPSSYQHKRARLSNPLMTADGAQPDLTRPTSPSRGQGPSRANSRASNRHSTRGGVSTRSAGERSTRAGADHRRNLSNSSIPLSAIISPRAPSVVSTGTFHMRDPRRPRMKETPWSLGLRRRSENGDFEGENSPLHGFLFFIGFILFPVWWAASFMGTPRTRHLAGSDTEKAQPLDDPQIEKDARTWRRRCRIMAVISVVTYIPFIVLVAVFAPRS